MDLEESLTKRHNQIHCMQAAVKMGFAPTSYYSDAQAGIIIMDYISAQPIVVSEEWLKQLAGLLRTLHAFNDFPKMHQSLFEYMQGLVESLRKIPLAPIIANYLKQFEEIVALLSPHLTLTSCHNDLNCKNLLFNDKIYLIDWEAAGRGDPFFDLATLCNEFMSSKSQENYFLIQYLGQEPTLDQVAKVLFMRQVSYCYLALHYLLHAKNGGLTLSNEAIEELMINFGDWVHAYKSEKFELSGPSDFLKYGLMQIQTSLDQMNTEEFSLAKKVLGDLTHEARLGASSFSS